MNFGGIGDTFLQKLKEVTEIPADDDAAAGTDLSELSEGELKARLHQKTVDHEALLKETQDLRKEYDTFKERAKTKVLSLKQQVPELAARNEALTAELEAERAAVAALERTRDDLEQDLAAAQQSKGDSNEMPADDTALQAQLEAADAAKAELEAQLAAERQTVTDLEQAREQLEQDLVAAQQGNDGGWGETSVDDGQVAALQGQLEAADAAKAELEAQLSIERKAMTDLEQARDGLQQALQTQLDTAKAELEAQLAAERKVVTDLEQTREQLEAADSAKTELEAQLAAERKIVTDLEQAHGQREQELDSQLAAERETVKNLEQAREELEQDLVAAQQKDDGWGCDNEMSAGDGQVTALQGQLEAAEAAKAELMAQLAAEQRNVTDLEDARDRLEAAEAEKAELQVQLAAERKIVTDLEQAQGRLEQDLVAAQKKDDGWGGDMEMSADDGQVTVLQTQLEAAEQAKAELEAQLATERVAVTDLEQARGRLEQDLLAAQQDKDEAVAAQTTSLQAQVHALQSAQSELATQLERSKEAVAAAQADVAALQAEAQSFDAERADLEEKATVALGEVSALRTAREELVAAEAALGEVRGKLAAAEAGSTEGAAVADELKEARWALEEEAQKLRAAQDEIARGNTAAKAAEARANRLQADLMGKEEDWKALLSQKDATFQTEVRMQEATADDLRKALQDVRAKLAAYTEAGAHASPTMDAQRDYAVLKEQHEDATVKLRQTLDALVRQEQAATRLTEELDAARAEVHELRDELARRRDVEETLGAAAGDAADARAAEAEAQVLDVLQTLQLREAELEDSERDRQALMQALQEAQAAAAAGEQRLVQHVAAASAHQTNLAAMQQQLGDRDYEATQLADKLAALVEESTAAAALSARRVAEMKKRLEDRDGRVDELLKVRDDQAARIRGLEFKLADAEGPRSASPVAAVRRSASKVAATMRSASMRPLTDVLTPSGFTWGRSQALVLVVLVCVWLLGMYHNTYHAAHVASTAELELSKTNAHLRAAVNTHKVAVEKCHAALRAALPDGV